MIGNWQSKHVSNFLISHTCREGLGRTRARQVDALLLVEPLAREPELHRNHLQVDQVVRQARPPLRLGFRRTLPLRTQRTAEVPLGLDVEVTVVGTVVGAGVGSCVGAGVAAAVGAGLAAGSLQEQPAEHFALHFEEHVSLSQNFLHFELPQFFKPVHANDGSVGVGVRFEVGCGDGCGVGCNVGIDGQGAAPLQDHPTSVFPP